MPTESGGVTLTNVAYAETGEGSDGSAAVNVDLLKDYVGENAAVYSASDGVAISDDNAISVNAGNGLEFAETADVDGTKKLQVNAGQGIIVDGNGVSVDIVQNGNLYFADGKLNSKDYRLIQGTDMIGGTEEEPVYGYKVKEDGTVELTVQDGTDESSKQTVTIADVASKSALDDLAAYGKRRRNADKRSLCGR